MNTLFEKETTDQYIDRISQLNADSKRVWGKMDVAQMLAHCSYTFDAAFDDNQPKPNAAVRFLIKLVAKSTLIGDKPYKRNMRTAPAFIVSDDRDFETEKKRLFDNLEKFREAGAAFFEGRAHPVLGPMSKDEWSKLISKHFDHHLGQFGV